MADAKNYLRRSRRLRSQGGKASITAATAHRRTHNKKNRLVGRVSVSLIVVQNTLLLSLEYSYYMNRWRRITKKKVEITILDIWSQKVVIWIDLD